MIFIRILHIKIERIQKKNDDTQYKITQVQSPFYQQKKNKDNSYSLYASGF